MKMTINKVFFCFLLFFSAAQFAFAQCPPPNDLQVTTSDWQHFDLTWPAVPGATGYVVTWQLNQNPVSQEELMAFPCAYFLSLGAPMTGSDQLTIQVQTICEGGVYSSEAITVFISNQNIRMPEISAPIYIIIDDLVIGKDAPQNICIASCSNLFAFREARASNGEGTQSGAGSTGSSIDPPAPPAEGNLNGWIGLQANAASVFQRDIFCRCISLPGSNEEACLVKAYYMDMLPSTFLVCTDTRTGERAKGHAAASKSVQFIPNPFTEQLNIRIYVETESSAQLRLRSSSGAILLDHSYQLVRGENNLSVPVSELPSGLMFGEIISDGQVLYVAKIMKN